MKRDYELQNTCNFRQENVLRILIDFLGEFLFFLSSILECNQFYTECQLEKLAFMAEKIHQIRLTLSREMENHYLNNYSSISSIVQELFMFVRYFHNEQQFDRMISTQILNRLERIIQCCRNLFRCYSSCTEPNVCIPWSHLEQMKRVNSHDEILGLVFGIKNKELRRKLGYGIEQQSSATNVSDMSPITSNSNRTSPKHLMSKMSETDFDQENKIQTKSSAITPKERSQLFMNSKDFLYTDDLITTSTFDHTDSSSTRSKTNLERQNLRDNSNQSLLSFQSATSVSDTTDSSLSVASPYMNKTWQQRVITPRLMNRSQDINNFNSDRPSSPNNDNISPLDFL